MPRWINISLAVMALSATMLADGVCRRTELLTRFTNGAVGLGAGKSVRVCAASDTATPCTPITIYADAATSQQISNPLATDNHGEYAYCVPEGITVREVFSGSGIATTAFKPITLGDPSKQTVDPNCKPDGNGTLNCSALAVGATVQIAAGGKGDGTTDDTAAIQAAINTARDAGGGVVLLKQGVFAHQGLTLYDGVRLIGAGNSYNGTGGSGHGTVLKNTSANPSITISGGRGYGFEVGNLHMVGAGTTDAGISLKLDGTTVPRSGYIHDVSIVGVGGAGVKIAGMSYVTFERVYVTGAAVGVDILPNPASYMEFGWFRNIALNDCATADIRIQSGNNLYFSYVDAGWSETGVLLKDAQSVFFDGLNVLQASANGIEIYGANAHTGRATFRNVTLAMKGASASERAIYLHREASYTTFGVVFDYLYLYMVGATAPTDAVYGDFGAIRLKFDNVRNTTGGKFNLAAGTDWGDYRLHFIDFPENGKRAFNGNGSQTAFTFTVSSASPYYSWPIVVTSTNQTIASSTSISNTFGGNFDVTVTFATAPASGTNNVVIYYAVQ